MVSITLRPLYPHTESWCTLDSRRGSAESRSGRFGEQKICYPAGIRSPDRPDCSLENIYRYLQTFHMNLLSPSEDYNVYVPLYGSSDVVAVEILHNAESIARDLQR